MSISDEEIITKCLPVLEDILLHPENTEKRIFITAYQVWLLLEQTNSDFCIELEKGYGTANGVGGGDFIGPIQRIEQALGRCPKVETQYLLVKYIMVGKFKLSGYPDCEIFRLRNKFEKV